MSKKKSFLAQVLKDTIIGTYWIFKIIVLIVWSILIKLLEFIGFAAGKVHGSARSAHSQYKIHKSQPKTPSSYDEIKSVTEVKGSIENFNKHLEKESKIIAIAGKRGSGKSALGFRLMENINVKGRPCFVLGVKQALLPVWIKTIDDINEVANNGVVLVDEGAISFGSRNSMSKQNKQLAELLAIARHKDLSLIFITQNTGMIDKNILNLCDTIILKEGSLLQEKMERSVMKDLYTTANLALKDVDKKSCFYVFDGEFEGLASFVLPSFWSASVSKSRA